MNTTDAISSTLSEFDLLPRTKKREVIAHDSRPRRTLSFYRYVQLADPTAFRQRLLAAWKPLGCLGRIYVAHEGINAQMNVPVENWDQFDAWVQAQPELAGVPYKFAVEEKGFSSFYKLTIKIRPKIVADGLDDASFDVTNTGEYLTAREMNEYVNDPEAVVVDMRNRYESEIGHFKNAVTPDVDTFREELELVPKILEGKKDKKVALYCTGGIRCEKASAWLKHQGFTNVKHLKGGVIDYKHQVEKEGLPNHFKGTNFVFDERLGERIGDEVISHCHLCKTEKTDQHHHCKNQVCHVLFLGCAGCVIKYDGYCSRYCQIFDKLPTKFKKVYARYYNQFFRPAQFKKARLRSS
ncbi:MAG: rhodanese-related sulfurtransferase [Candidatus Paceibacteria bacterium]